MDRKGKNINNLNLPGTERMEQRDEKDERGYSNRTGDLDRVGNMDTDLDSGLDNTEEDNQKQDEGGGDILDTDADYEEREPKEGPGVPGDSDIDLNYDRGPTRRNVMYGPESRRGNHPDKGTEGSGTGS